MMFKNDLTATVPFKIGDCITTQKDGHEFVGKVVAVNGQQLTCENKYGIFYAWSWQSHVCG